MVGLNDLGVFSNSNNSMIFLTWDKVSAENMNLSLVSLLPQGNKFQTQGLYTEII